jgi:hypothetical protein
MEDPAYQFVTVAVKILWDNNLLKRTKTCCYIKSLIKKTKINRYSPG